MVINKKVPYYKVAVPAGLPDIALRDKWTKSLSLYITLKSCFNNSCIYDYSSRSTEGKLKSIFDIEISHSYLSKHISLLIKTGLARMSGKNLILASYKDLTNITEKEIISSKRIVIFTSKSIKEQNLIIKGRFIKKHLQTQEFQIRRKLDAVLLLKRSQSNGALTSAENKQLRTDNSVFGYGKREKVNKDLVLTLKNIQDMFGISRPSANKLKKELVELGFIKSQYVKGGLLWRNPPVGGVRPFMENLPNKSFLYHGSLYNAPRCVISMGDMFTRSRK